MRCASRLTTGVLVTLLPVTGAAAQPAMAIDDLGVLCEVAPPNCVGPLCHTMPAPLGALARPSFADPDGSLWAHDVLGATWKVTADGATFVSNDTLVVGIADDDIRWAARVAGTQPPALLRRVGDGPFVDDPQRSLEEVFGSLGLVHSLFGSGDHDVWVHVGPIGTAPGSGIPRPPRLFHFDGVTWSEAPGEWPDIPSAFAADATHAWAIQGAGGPGIWTLMAWDGVAWSPVDLDGEGLVTDVAGRAADDVWAISGRTTSRLWHFDGIDWSVVGPAHAPLALTDDGAVWAQQPIGTLARFVDGVPSPTLSPLQATGLIADGDAVWLATATTAPSDGPGLLRVEVAGSCGVDVDGEVVGVGAGGRAFASWVTLDARGPRTFLAARASGTTWQHWRLPEESFASLFGDHETAWAALTIAPQGLPHDSALLRFDGSQWSSVLDLPAMLWRDVDATGDGVVWMLAGDVAEPTRATLWRGDSTGFAVEEVFEGFVVTTIATDDDDVLVAGEGQLWQRRDGVWSRQADTEGHVSAMEVRSRDEAFLVDDGALTRLTAKGRQVLCPIPLEGRRGIVDIGLVDDGVWVVTTTRLYHWDGAALREGPVVTDDEDGPRGIIAGRIGNGAAWLTTRDGLLEVALEKGAPTICEGSSPTPGEREAEDEGDGEAASGCTCRSLAGDGALLVVLMVLLLPRRLATRSVVVRWP